MRAILLNEEALEEEILEGLIRSLKIVPPNAHEPPSYKEVVFPAHIIGLSLTQMWRYGYLPESEHLIFTAMDTIQKYCLVTKMVMVGWRARGSDSKAFYYRVSRMKRALCHAHFG